MKRKKNKRRLPPFAKPLADARQRGLVPRRQEWHVVVSLEWRDPAPRWPVVVVPPGSDPYDFDWRFLAGLKILVMHWDREMEQACRVMTALYAARASSVELLNMDKPEILRFYPLFKRMPDGKA